MKFNISKEWLLKGANLEKGLEIGAGGPIISHAAASSLDWKRFPIKEMYKRNWFEGFAGSLTTALTEAEPLLTSFVERAMRRPAVALQRQKIRNGSQADKYALLAWQCRVLLLAKTKPPKNEYKQSTLNADWLSALAQLSRFNDGPIRAQKYLMEAGIIFVVEPHLPSTHLDGAALLSDNGPVIALTLRYDRLDNFWFVLFHEIIHVKKHLRKGSVEDIFDDLGTEGSPSVTEVDGIEQEADALACESLIPAEIWKTAIARFVRSEQSVKTLADKIKINPAIVAGRIQKETKNYAVLRTLIGQGEVRKLFPNVHFGRI